MHDQRSTRRAFVGGLAAATLGTLAGCGGDERLPPPVRGDPDAEVTVEVFSDFRCPHCASFALQQYPASVESAPSIREFVRDGRIRYEHRDFPIPVSPQSRPAANAARAVQESVGDEAFWTFSTGLYENQSSLGATLYGDLAGQVGADPETVRSAAENRRYAATIDADQARGSDYGVRATPTVVVDGDPVDQPAPAAVVAAIQSALSQ